MCTNFLYILCLYPFQERGTLTTSNFTEFLALSTMAICVSVVSVKQQALLYVLMVHRTDMEMDNCPKRNTYLVKHSQVEISFISINTEC